MLTTARRVGGVVMTTALVAALVGVAAVSWLVRQEGWLVQTVATGSMAPAIPTGSVIVSRPVDPADVEVGDVIVFASPTGATVSGGADGVFQATEAMLITHRVVRVTDDGQGPMFRTRGDSNAEDDPWVVPGETVRARYVGHVPGLGGVLTFPGLRRWLYLAVAAIGAVVVVVEVRSIVRQVRTTRDRADPLDPAPDAGPSHPADADPGPGEDDAESPATGEPRSSRVGERVGSSSGVAD